MVRFFITLIITIAIVIALDVKIGPIPPLGKFLDPASGFWANAESGIALPKNFEIPGLSGKVKILYDDMLVPHIFADHEDDLFVAIGYVHACHRLWQMEFQTHAAAGRLSEIVGELTLDMDRWQRRKGMTFGAKNFIENMDVRSRQLNELYALGVNAYISRLSYKTYPFEYKLLDYRPEKWTSDKSGLLYKFMADMLNSSERDFENTNFKSIYGKELLDLIYPDVENYKDAVVDQPNGWKFDPIVKHNKQKNINGPVSLNLQPKPSPSNGSNNWAIAPTKSATGNALLCNDMHLKLYMPSLWFYNQLNCGDINVFGHSLPGVPFVITGFTDSIAWGMTNAQRDLVDWYKIEFKDETRSSYLLNGEYVPTKKVVEEIKIRSQETFYDTVVYTEFGPVSYDPTYRGESQKAGYARRWIDHDPSDAFKMFYGINRAKGFDDYMEALNYFTSPAQNVVFASSKGDIAHRVQGKYPLNDYEEGKFLKDGTSSSNNWTQYIPNAHNPFWKNPERGFVSSANQHPADSTYPYYVTSTKYETYRNRRINDVLRSDDSVTIDDLKNLHFDNYSLKAEESLPLMLECMKGAALSAPEMNILEKLARWDRFYNKGSDAAVYYEIWYSRLYDGIWDEIRTSLENDIALRYPTDYSTIKLMKEHPELDFFDDKLTDSTETVRDLILRAFKEMIGEVEMLRGRGDISWATYKDTYIGHQLRIGALGDHNILTGGNRGAVVNATGANHGPSQRIIVELDPKGIKAWGHYPGGQSGNPGSKYYDHMVEAWATGHYYELLFLTGPDPSNPRIIFSQTLTSTR
ncbi:MAG: penicillin acylase family protein [Cytophagales bacterium]|nr:penicillin acylase family protein [Cytophagales bacterium]